MLSYASGTESTSIVIPKFVHKLELNLVGKEPLNLLPERSLLGKLYAELTVTIAFLNILFLVGVEKPLPFVIVTMI